MSFWLAAILFTALAVAAVLMPLTRRQRTVAAAAANDLEVYRDQLAEIDRDAERGLIGPAETEEARAEIGRRILRTARDEGALGGSGRTGSGLSRALAFTAVLSVPLVSWGLYGVIGSPDLPSQPLAARLSIDPAHEQVQELVARVEAQLSANPQDVRGWDVLAPVYVKIGRYDDAVRAYAEAIRLAGPSAIRETGLGEALAAAAGGRITAEAKAAFQRAAKLDPRDPKAQFFLASALAQDGRIAEAAEDWKAMRQGLPVDSPWLAIADQVIAEADRRLAAAEQPPGPPKPSQDDIDAASQMSDEDRNAMIATMVAQLDERLRENPHDPEGWQRLVRSYVVLGKSDEARDALARGIAALGQKSRDATTLQAFAESIGLTGAE